MESHRPDTILSALDRRLRTGRLGVLLFYGYLVGILIAGVVAVVAIDGNHSLAEQAKTTAAKANSAAAVATRSLCFQKQAAVSQLRGTRKFLRQHPDGTPDFSRALILNAIHNDDVDVAALHDVRCHGVPR